MLVNKCSLLSKAEYSCVQNVAQEEQFVSHINVSARHDPGDNMKPTTVLQKTLEKQAVAEYLPLTAITVETEGSKYSHRDMIMKLNDVTTYLNDESDEERTKQWNMKMQSDAELEIGELTDRLFEESNKGEGGGDYYEEYEEDNSGTINVTIDLADIGNEVEGNTEGIDKGINMNENTTGELSGNETMNISLHEGNNVKVILASLNKFFLKIS